MNSHELPAVLQLKPIISYPREAQVGKTYLVSIDVQLATPNASWDFPEEEYTIGFILNTSPYFICEPLHDIWPTIILHRYGGTYGPAEFLLTAADHEIERGQISITLVNGWGIPMTRLELPCEVGLDPGEPEIYDEFPLSSPQEVSELADSDPLIEAQIEEIRRNVMNEGHLQTEDQAPKLDAGTAIQLRDVEIRPAFLKALEEAQEQIIIYSPWVNEQVIDDDFVSLLETLVKKGVHILIGHGIGQQEQREERPIPPALQQRLRTIQTVEGIPGIIVEWLGNSHAKEVIIDRKNHFNGSHNWLSYRGDHRETVYQVTIVSEVEKAYNHLAQRFLQRAQTLWERGAEEERRIALCIYGYLGEEQETLKWIQHDRCYSYLPLWLALAQQAISFGYIERLLIPIKTVILLSLKVFQPQDLTKTEVVAALQKVLKQIGQDNTPIFTQFVSDNQESLNLLEMHF